MSEKVVTTVTVGPVPEKNGPVVGFASDVEKKKKTRQAVSIESLLASIRALDEVVPSGSEEDDVPRPVGDVVVSHRVDIHGKTGVSVTCGHYQTMAPTLKVALQHVVEYLEDRVLTERARMTESLDAVLREHGAKRRRGDSLMGTLIGEPRRLRRATLVVTDLGEAARERSQERETAKLMSGK